ncbi:sugar ABC transporter permease [Rossellomorea marisflavi]|uniref:Sugar ABC transporter permease n=1 Tax=Rossellomorea marisflavi TaxID=189381 RepID=A0A5D4RS58_9BACI|nr:sugar ABC transporter permease [Rossellomorea marisflavi]KQU60677.1 sugar ABC transporter permease [Bacillus sp. Leaf406]MBV6682922.1 sugar ABC transporter permease [Bacillus sp. JRC01]MDW4526154.1 sugar ABC transporter permease [Rossellomorea marisflavi]TYS54185.1 sugar ABC transporter permease [Rossellomorea marisflavi]UKS66823.1 sugar ABC transporter permease [Rossellomorea marisflavi]
MDQSNPTTKHRKTALALSLIPGLGQLYHRQILKGVFFLIMTLSFILVFKDLISLGLWGITTLGTDVSYGDHSIFLMVYGILAIIVILFGIAFYLYNLRDAYKNGVKRDNGEKIATIREQYRNLVDNGFPYLIMSPGFLLLIFVVIFPIIFVVLLAFTNYDLYHSPPAKLVDWVGIQNFVDIFKIDIWRETFVTVLAWTLVWTLGATTLQVALGIFLAIIVNQKDLKGKAIIRTVLILPWAIPAFVSILVFAGMFNESFGAINRDILGFFGIEGLPWMTEPLFSRIALIMIQMWLGFPFIFAMTTGVLQSIPDELYEAATVDGASAVQKFKNITLPLVLFATAPIIITQYTFNFNNFNVIYLFNGGGPALTGQNAGGTDILISWIYRLTMTSAQYSKAAAITLLLSIIVITVAIWQFKKTKSFQEEDMM